MKPAYSSIVFTGTSFASTSTDTALAFPFCSNCYEMGCHAPQVALLGHTSSYYVTLGHTGALIGISGFPYFQSQLES